MGKFAFGLALASMSSLASGGSTRGSSIKTYKVRVTNLTFKQDLGPLIVVAHEKDSAPLFNEGGKSTNAIKLMAEEGSTRKIERIALGDPGYSCGFARAPGYLLPGNTWEVNIRVDENKCKDAVYSVMAKLTNTNDAFMGIDGAKFPKKRPSKRFPPAFDAGTEKNNEKCTCMPGRACPASPKTRENHGRGSEGFIHVHRGIQGVGDLSQADYDWENPVAEVVVSEA